MSADQDLHEPRARRYAEALATAAAADQRISELTEKLAEHEWHRTEAEAQLSLVQYSETIGKVYHHGDDMPDVTAVMDLSNGQVWRREYEGSTYWLRADRDDSGQTRYEWPIQDVGPLVAFDDTWILDQQNNRLRKYDETENALHRILNGKDGYRPADDPSWGRPSLPDAVSRVIAALDRRWVDASSEKQTAQQEVHRLKAEIDQINAALDPSEATS